VKPVLFRPAAAADVEDAYNWTSSNAMAWGASFWPKYGGPF
jgi:hypothetical protein